MGAVGCERTLVSHDLTGVEALGGLSELVEELIGGAEPHEGGHFRRRELAAEDSPERLARCRLVGRRRAGGSLAQQLQGLLEATGEFGGPFPVEAVDEGNLCFGLLPLLLGQDPVLEQIILGRADIGGGDLPCLIPGSHELLAGEDDKREEKNGEEKEDAAVALLVPRSGETLEEVVQDAPHGARQRTLYFPVGIAAL
jgi:hypothetical protein